MNGYALKLALFNSTGNNLRIGRIETSHVKPEYQSLDILNVFRDAFIMDSSAQYKIYFFACAVCSRCIPINFCQILSENSYVFSEYFVHCLLPKHDEPQLIQIFIVFIEIMPSS